MRIGITGHMDISGETARRVTEALRAHLAPVGRSGLTGVTALARGADTIFAEIVLELGGKVEVLVASADYRQSTISEEDTPRYDAIVAAADTVTVLPFETAGPEAYAAANRLVLSTVDELVAVWDGLPAPDHGGTGGAVAEARSHGLPVVVIWPEGSVRG